MDELGPSFILLLRKHSSCHLLHNYLITMCSRFQVTCLLHILQINKENAVKLTL